MCIYILVINVICKDAYIEVKTIFKTMNKSVKRKKNLWKDLWDFCWKNWKALIKNIDTKLNGKIGVQGKTQ